MSIEEAKKEILAVFPDAQPARLFLTKQNLELEESHGFTPENTRFAEGGCSDEINEPEYQLMERYWGERFKFGGLAGYCHGGKSSLAAVSIKKTDPSNLATATAPMRSIKMAPRPDNSAERE